MKLAITSNVPGTTRDRMEGVGCIAGLPIDVIDTGGLDDRGKLMAENVKNQVEYAINDADIILFLVDAKDGITTVDLHFANWMRRRLHNTKTLRNIKSNSSIILVANKTEGAHLSDKVLDTVSEALTLGLGEPLLISASHGDGISDLASALIAKAKLLGFCDEIVETNHTKITVEERVIQLAVMGRPNTGKSSFINAIVGEDRLIVTPVSGTTRDAIHVEWTYCDRKFQLVDTAGLIKIKPDATLIKSSTEAKRRKVIENTGRYDKTLPGVGQMSPEDDPSQFSSQVSELAIASALNALRFAQVVLLMIEGDQGNFSKIDLQIARKCLVEGRSLVVGANKSDLVKARGISCKAYEEGVKKHCEALMREMGEVKVVAFSALTKEGIERALDAVISTHDAWSKRLSTWVLNKWLKDMLITHPVPIISGRKLNVKYITQIKARPPTFCFFSNVVDVPLSFQRFLRSRLQHDFNLEGVPVRFVFRRTQKQLLKRKLVNGELSDTKSIADGPVKIRTSRPLGKKNRKDFMTVKNIRKSRLMKRITRKRKQKGRWH